MNRYTVALILGLVFCAVLVSRLDAPSEGPTWTPPGKGWWCIADSCARPADVVSLRNHPGRRSLAEAWVVVAQRSDGTIDYWAAPTQPACEALDMGPCEVMP